ncbi:MAG: hypothetical protein M1820_003640 [Bogoriella megaspora]|nr:MAG: hypothetical protein M1820_003640 [Bogoriella megaspora]
MATIELLTYLLLTALFANAQSVLDVLSSQPDLSRVTSLIAGFPQFSKRLNASFDFTFLAPSDDAIAVWLNSSALSDGFIQATLEYHLVDATMPSADIVGQPNFYFTALNDTAYTNITFDGFSQLFEAIDDDGALFISGNKSESRIEVQDVVCTGGIIQIIDRVLSIPTDVLTEATAANLNVFIDLLSRDNFTAAEKYKTQPKTTFFAPNSTAAIITSNSDAFNKIYNLNLSTLNDLYDYHVLDGLWYSPVFNGTNLEMKDGKTALVTLGDDGDIWINQAKITGKDYLIANGVMHVIDDILQPGNLTRPAIASAGKNVSTSPPTTPGTDPTTAARPPSSNTSKLSTGAKAGIGVGVTTASLLIIVAAVSLCFRRGSRRREGGRSELEGTPQPKQTAELANEGPVQLDSHQRPVEMGEDQRHELG